MTLNPEHGAYSARSSILSFDKSTVMVWVAISLLVVETFSGALRFYLDQAGLNPLLYLPKIACVLLFVGELYSFKAARVFWLCMLGWLLSSLLALLHGASVKNLAFSLFAISPLLFGLVCSGHLLHRRKLLGRAIAFCLLASLIGLLLDKYTQVPWKGYSYNLGDTQLSGNTAWSAEDQDRVAGFARMSSVLSAMIAFYSLYLLLNLRSAVFRLALAGVGFVAIVLTTSKAPAGAFALTLGLLMIVRMNWTSRLLCVLVVAIGLLLPLTGLLMDFDARTVSSAGSSLASLYDRLNNTWPNLIAVVNREGWGYGGAGFGMVGSSLAVYPVSGAQILMIADSSAVYLWAMLGVCGLLLYALQVALFFNLLRDGSRLAHMLLSIGVCWCLISWTSDMFEIAIANLFLGLIVGYAISAKPAPEPLIERPAQPHTLPLAALP